MAIVKLSGSSFIDLAPWYITGVWSTGTAVINNATTDVVYSPTSTVLMEGAGLGAFDAHGFATNGTVNHFGTFEPSAKVDVTGLSASASAIEAAYKSANGNALFHVLFAGNDKITLNSGGALVNGWKGNDTIVGNKGYDVLKGGDGNDTLKGGKGGDFLEGDKGSDHLTGNKGGDIFKYNDVSDSNTAHDTITDLQNDDTIDL